MLPQRHPATRIVQCVVGIRENGREHDPDRGIGLYADRRRGAIRIAIGGEESVGEFLADCGADALDPEHPFFGRAGARRIVEAPDHRREIHVLCPGAGTKIARQTIVGANAPRGARGIGAEGLPDDSSGILHRLFAR